MYVIDNESKLNSIVNNIINKKQFKKPLVIESYTLYEDSNVIEFEVKSLSKQYSGFYYSQNDIPFAFQNTNNELKKENYNTWSWKDGNNGGITIKIKNNWYYYEAKL